MAHTVFTRATSDVPGAGQGEHYYSSHPSGLARLLVWRPGASFQGAPLILFVKGGDFLNFGDAFSAPDNFDPTDPAWSNDVATDLSAAGWVVATADYPPGPHTVAPNLEVPGFSLFPETEGLIGAAVSYLKTNASGESSGLRGTKKGLALWGSDNSIDPARIVVIGIGTGGTLALMAALCAQGELPAFGQGRASATKGTYLPRSSTKPRAVISIGAAVDWTQFFVRATSHLSAFQLDRHPHFGRLSSTRTWSGLEPAVKQAASPYHQLLRGLPENRSLAVYASWPGTTTAQNAALGPQDFAPGVVQSNLGVAKAFTTPGHFFQGRAWDLAAAAHLSELSRTRWGTGVQNPTTPHLTGAALQVALVDWLTNVVEV